MRLSSWFHHATLGSQFGALLAASLLHASLSYTALLVTAIAIYWFLLQSPFFSPCRDSGPCQFLSLCSLFSCQLVFALANVRGFVLLWMLAVGGGAGGPKLSSVLEWWWLWAPCFSTAWLLLCAVKRGLQVGGKWET